MTDIYQNGTYLQTNPTWHEEDSRWKATQIARIIEKNQLTPATICEIGCGAGEILNQLSGMLAADVHYSGYEISPQAFELCQKKGKGNLRFFLKDLLQDDGTTFDMVMAIDVFEHVEDYFGFLRQLKRKGTYKIFHIPLELSVQMVWRASQTLHLRKSLGHIHSFTKETALATLSDTGYEIVDHFYTNSSLELPNRSWKADLLKLPRKLLFSISQDLTARVLGGFSLLVLAK
jgi:cyclopropane fatty-acyl-phospholipid synthase-like methyltransferase